MRYVIVGLLSTALLALSACQAAGSEQNAPAANVVAETDQSAVNLTSPASGTTSIVRLHCGGVDVKEFTKVFSDNNAYPPGHKHLTSSCYLITHNGRRLIWDTGFSADLKGKKQDMGAMVASLDKTIAEELTELGLKPADVEMVGISHNHGDHVGQLPEFAGKPLFVGKADFDGAAGKPDDPFAKWRAPGQPLNAMTGDRDVFGDGNVIALFLPGHTPGHYGLLVKLKSGPVLLSGDAAHAREAFKLKAVPTFNTDREQTLQSMERVEKIAKDTGAKIVVQHDERDIALLPAFPKAAE